MGEVIRRTKSGRFLGWYLRFYEGGKRRIIASRQASHADARRMLLEIEARIARGEVGLAARSEAHTLGELVERFLREYSRPRIKDLDRYRHNAEIALQRAKAFFAKRADHLTALEIGRMREALRRDYAPATARVTLAFLSTVYSWAVREGLLALNPCRGVERPQSEGSLQFLSLEEVGRLLDVATAEGSAPGAALMPRMLLVAILLALHTGMRKGELLGLRWIDLDLPARRLTIARSFGRSPKSGKARHLRLPQALVPVLEAWRRDCPSASGHVLPAGKGDRAAGESAMLGIRRLWALAGLREVDHPFHLLRHTFASHYIMAGGNILALQKILGHSDLKMTLVYAHLAPEFLDGELDRVKFR